MSSVHDYWIQSLQNQAQPQGGAGIGVPQMAAPAQVPSGGVSPLVSGARAAQEAVRNSKESEPSFASNLLNTLGSALSNYSLGSLRTSPVPSARAVGNMMKTVDEREYERQQEEKANKLLQLKYLEKQMERQRKDERDAALDAYRNKSLSERARHNLVMESKKGAGGEKEKKLTPKLQTRLALVDAAKRQLKSFSESFDEFEGLTKNNIFSPVGSVPGVNAAKKLLSKRAPGLFKETAKENVVRSRLVSKATRLEPILEALESQKAPGEQMLKRFHNLEVYFGLEQPADVIRDKIEDVMNELENTERSIRGGEYVPRSTQKKAPNFSPEALKEAQRQLQSEQGGFSKEALEAAKRELEAENE